jgi:hypothetical protein
MSKGHVKVLGYLGGAALVVGAAIAGCNQWPGIQIEERDLVSPNNAITQGADELRSNWYPDQPGLDPAIVGGPNFKRLFTTTLPSAGEKVLAQPLVYAGKVLIVTEQNNLYLLDPVSGAITSQRSLGAGFDATKLPEGSCGDITPAVGVTGTPVIDNVSGTAYFFSKASSGAYSFHAIDATTLAERSGFPVAISGAAQNDSSVTFDSTHQHQRPGLLLMGGVVYGGFASHCDIGTYQGWIIGVSTSGAIKARFSTESGAGHGHGSGIWMSGSGLSSDGAGQILFATGNAGGNPTYPSTIASNAPPANLEEAAARAVVQADGSLKATDFFAPFNAQQMGDNDLAGGGIVSLPPQFSTTSVPHTAVIVGKAGFFYLLNRDKLGGYRLGSGGGDSVLTTINLSGGTWGHPAAWPGDGGWVFVTTNGGTGGLGYRLQVLKFGTSGSNPTFTLAGTAESGSPLATDNFGAYSGSPIVTSNNTNAGSAVVWAVGNTAQLRAYKLVSPNLVRIFADSTSSTAKFQTVGVGAGRVYVGTGDGKVLGWGAATGALSGPSVSFGTVTSGQTKQMTATFTASSACTINAGGITSTGAPFTIPSPSPATNTALAANGTINVTVTFAPTAAGSFSGSLNAVCAAGGGGTIALSGTGQVNAPQLNVTPSSLNFGGIVIGSTSQLSLQLQNTGNQALTISSSTLPAAPYSVSTLPTSIAAMSSVNVTVTFAPTAAGTFNSSLVINSNGGNATIPLAGTSGTAPVMVISPMSLDFGTVAVGSSKSLSFTISNTGGTDLSFPITKNPGPPFAATTVLNEGDSIPAGQSRTETVSFTPTAVGTFTGGWEITGSDDPMNRKTVTLTGVGSSAPAALPRTGWAASASNTGGTDVPANAIDASTTTRWSTGVVMAAGMWFQADMGSAQTVSQIQMDSANGDYARAFSVYVTNDPANLGTAVATATASATPVVVPFTAKSGRYIRVVLGTIPAGTTAWWSIQDFNAFGSGGGGGGGAITINAGSTAAVSPFVADVDFTGGSMINHANTIDVSGVTGPAPAAVYQTARVGNFTYTIPGFAAGSSHTVRLHMCETYHTGAGQRTFNVSINGTQVLSAFDIFATAGATNKATVQQFTTTANASGQYVIQFTTVLDNSLVSGIEIN